MGAKYCPKEFWACKAGNEQLSTSLLGAHHRPKLPQRVLGLQAGKERLGDQVLRAHHMLHCLL